MSQIDDVLKYLNKELGQGVVRPLGNVESRVATRSTGLMSLDLAINDGLPKGRMIEIWGSKSVGKSTLVQQFIGQYLAENPNGWALLIDAEHTYQPSWGAVFGVDPERTLIIRGGMVESEKTTELYAERLLGAVEKALIVENPPGIIVVDSIPALVPKAEWEKEMDEQTMGGIAKMLGLFCRKAIGTGYLEKSGATLIMVNQVREKVGARSPIPGFVPETRPGGRAIGFFSSLQCEVKRGEKVMGEDEMEGKIQVGHEIVVKVEKCKYNGPPFKTATLVLDYRHGFDFIDDLVATALKLRVIERRGAIYSFQDQRWKGREEVMAAVRESSELQSALRATLLSR